MEKIYSVLQVVLGAMIVLSVDTFSPFTLIFIFIGAFLWMYSWITLGKSWSLGLKPKKIIKNGLYKYIKHPLYLGVVIMLSGVWLNSIGWINSAFLCLFILITFIKAKKEEKYLKLKKK